MPFVIHDDRFDTVIEFMRTHSGGVTLGQVMTRFTPPLNRRTAQRMMADLIKLGVLTTNGEARARQYHLRKKPGPYGTTLWITPSSALAQAVAPSAPPAPPPTTRAARSK